MTKEQVNCAGFKRHVWMYPGKRWPYKGQPCACGKTVWTGNQSAGDGGGA